MFGRSESRFEVFFYITNGKTPFTGPASGSTNLNKTCVDPMRVFLVRGTFTIRDIGMSKKSELLPTSLSIYYLRTEKTKVCTIMINIIIMIDALTL